MYLFYGYILINIILKLAANGKETGMRGNPFMKFVFVCPNQNAVFESSDFRILDNRGVVVDKAGNKTLDAKVALEKPCPFCGAKHVYQARDLSCPFNDPNRIEEAQVDGR
jgi:hypothetical protein